MVHQYRQLLYGPSIYSNYIGFGLYFKFEGGRLVMILLYVDVLFLRGEDKLIEDARRRLATEFEMKYLGMMHYFLGMEVWKNVYGIFLGEGKYA